MNPIIPFIYALRQRQGILWFENDRIKLSLATDSESQHTQEFIRAHRNELVTFLQNNSVNCAEDFLKRKIFIFETPYFPLSPAQERLWFIEQYEGGTHAYHIPVIFEMSEHPDVDALKYALQLIVDRHEVLRTTISQTDDGEPFQLVHNKPLTIAMAVVQNDEGFKVHVRESINKTFDHNTEYPIRVTLYRIDQPDSHYLLSIIVHHIAFDGRSVEVFQKEIAFFYDEYKNGRSTRFHTPLEIQYKDYALWQRALLSGKTLETQLTYWRNKLTGYQQLDLPTDYQRTNRIDYRGESVQFTISKNISDRLTSFAMHYGVTLHGVLLSSVAILLGKYAGQDDVVIGTTILNRPYRQLKELIGVFVNLQVNRIILNQSQTFSQLLSQVHHDQAAAQQYQNLPFEKIVDELQPERDLSRHPVFQVMFGMRSFDTKYSDVDQPVNHQSASVFKPYKLATGYDVEKFDLSIFIDQTQQQFAGQISFATRLFKRETIERLAEHYKNLLVQIVSSPEKPYSTFNLLHPTELEKIVYQWNRGVSFESNETIHRLFEKQAERSLCAVALAYEDVEVTYEELNLKSNQLARVIRRRHLLAEGKEFQPSTMVVVYVERSIELVVGILAILKAGGAYVPIDPEYPEDRTKYVLADAGNPLILARRTSPRNQAPFSAERIIYIDFTEEFYLEEDASNLDLHNTPSGNAYVIYTSGTTGKPNGVIQTHANVVRLFTSTADLFQFNDRDVWTLFHSYTFDFSVWEMWGALIYGGKLIIVSKEETRDMGSFFSLCKRFGVTILNQTPTAFFRFVDALDGSNFSPRFIIFGGEALNLSMLEPWWQYHKQYNLKTRLINMYGITETTVHATFKELSHDRNGVCSNIGRPLGDLQAYVLDKYRIPVPIGIVGELYIGGAGLARGYLNNSELTNARFLLNPFRSDSSRNDPHSLLYKTGDLVRWLPDGELEYIGRNDSQVKIRGHRIELGEIEHILASIPGVNQCCVVAKERPTEIGPSKYLVAYVVPALDVADLTSESIINKLSNMLPEYMQPSAVVIIESFPLTINGKLDKKALPHIEVASSSKFIPPSSNFERMLCRIWEEVLQVEKVGVQDDFFRIGGDSILSIRVIALIRKIGYSISVKDIFQWRTIAQLAKRLTKTVTDREHFEPFTLISITDKRKLLEENRLSEHEIADIYPASYLQSGMLYESLAVEDNDIYHDVFSYQINAAFDAPVFKTIWAKLVQMHEQLRTSFIRNEMGYWNVVHVSISIDAKIELIGSDELSEDVVCREKNKKFNPSVPGLFRLLVVPGNGMLTLVFSFHHAIADGWSIASLMSAFADAYVHRLPLPAPRLPLYSRFVYNEMQAVNLEANKTFWRDYLSDYELKLDNLQNKTAANSSNGQLTEIDKLDTETSTKVLNLAQELHVSPDMIFLAAYSLVISSFYSTDDMILGVVVNNRLEEEGGDALFGLHLNTIPMRFGTDSLAETGRSYIVNTVKNREKLRVFQLYPYAKIKSDLGLQTDIYQSAFNYVHFHVAEKGIKDHSLTPKFSHEKTNLPLFVHIVRFEHSFTLALNASQKFVSLDLLRKLVKGIHLCIDQMTSTPDKLLKDYRFISTNEYSQIIHEWNKTGNNFPCEKAVHVFFEEQAEKSPFHPAVIFENQILSYKQLNEKSNVLARQIIYEFQKLTGGSFKIGTPIPLFLDRSIEVVIAILAVLKAGGVYVPIDTAYPSERIKYILDDISATLVLTHSQAVSRMDVLGKHIGKPLLIDVSEDFYLKGEASNLNATASGSDLAYILYTSGTMGKPKGVMLEHAGLVNRILHMSAYSNVGVSDVHLLKTNYVFDVSFGEIFMHLFAGATIQITKYGFDLNELAALLGTNRFTSLHLVPSQFELVRDIVNAAELKKIYFSGEALTPHVLSEIKSGVTVFNYYGPTELGEVTVFTPSNPSEASVIGKVFPNCRHYVLDNKKRPVPIGVIGELYVGGRAMARGYLNNEDLTKQRFVGNPFLDEDNNAKKDADVIYKTGDLVRWLEDGNLEYIGRSDDQVKIRGQRVELAEIEMVFGKIHGIRQCCVLAKEQHTQHGVAKYLVGYYVTLESGTALTPGWISQKLSEVLPDYMLPAIFVRMEEFPMTANGKLNKRALPEPDFNQGLQEYIAPASQIEKEICDIWQNILGKDRVGLTDDFFSLGGNSLLAIRVSHLMSKVLETNVTAADIFESKTIYRLIDNLSTARMAVENLEKEF